MMDSLMANGLFCQQFQQPVAHVLFNQFAIGVAGQGRS
jgi:hypothetical protein